MKKQIVLSALFLPFMLACSSSVPPSGAEKALLSTNVVISDGNVNLNWDQSGTFNIYRSNDPEFVIGVNTLLVSGLGANSYNDGVAAGGNFYYRVEGVEADSLSARINALNIPPAVPEGLRFNQGLGYVSLDWNQVDGVSYRIYRDTVSPVSLINPIGSVQTAGFKDSATNAGQTYYYVLVAENQLASSSPSQQLQVATQPLTSLPPVQAVFPDSGANWNDYIERGQDSVCVKTDCVHGGEIKSITLTGIASCQGLTAADELDVFAWQCDESTDPVHMRSTGMKPYRYLSQLLDFNATPINFLSNSVIVYRDEAPIAATQPAVWWSNPIIVVDKATAFDQSEAIYVVDSNRSEQILVQAPQIAVVVKPGIKASRLYADSLDFLWVEGEFNGSGFLDGVRYSNVSYSVLRNIKAYNAGTQNLTLSNVSYSRFQHIYTANAPYGINLNTARYIYMSNVNASNNYKAGILASSSYAGTFDQIVASNNGRADETFGTGLRMDFNTTKNVFRNISCLNNKSQGIWLGQSASNNRVFNNYFSNLLLSGNKEGLVHNPGISSNSYHNVVATDNREIGIWFSESDNNIFSGKLLIGNNAVQDCVISGAEPGLLTKTCKPQGSSTFIAPITSQTIVASIMGQSSADSSNTSQINGTALFSPNLDWVHFDQDLKNWGTTDAFGTVADLACTSGTCQIWDWSLKNSDTVVLNQNPVPDGSDGVSFDGGTFLRYAKELDFGDGDHDGRCEANEHCLVLPHYGAYAGHGTLVPVDYTPANSLTGITLYQFSTQGYPDPGG